MDALEYTVLIVLLLKNGVLDLVDERTSVAQLDRHDQIRADSAMMRTTCHGTTWLVNSGLFETPNRCRIILNRRCTVFVVVFVVVTLVVVLPRAPLSRSPDESCSLLQDNRLCGHCVTDST